MKHKEMTEEQISVYADHHIIIRSLRNRRMEMIQALIHQGKWAETVGPLDQLAEEGHPAALYWLAMMGAEPKATVREARESKGCKQ